MQRLDLKTGFACNSRCRFCVQGDKRSRILDRSTAELLASLQSRRGDCDEVVFTGGEVTLRKDLTELVREARALGYRTIQIQTNGRLLSRMDRVDALLEAGATEFSPALHGVDSATHDGLTGARGSFRQSLRGIVNLRRRGARVCTNTVVVRDNMEQLPELARLFVELDVQQFQLAFVHALGSAATNFEAVVPRYRDLQPWLHRALSIGRLAGLRCMTEAVPYCWMHGWEDHVAERGMPDLSIVEPDRQLPSYTDWRKQDGKAQGPPCQACTWSAVCEGPWCEYPARFGWDEFRTRQDPPFAAT